MSLFVMRWCGSMSQYGVCTVCCALHSTQGEVKGKLANGVGSQCPSHYLGTLYIQHYSRWCAPADWNGLVRFAERRNLVSARLPSHFKRSLRPDDEQ